MLDVSVDLCSGRSYRSLAAQVERDENHIDLRVHVCDSVDDGLDLGPVPAGKYDG